MDWDNKPTPYKAYVDLPSVPLASSIRPPQVPTLRAIAGTGPPPGGDRRPDRDAVTQLCYLSAGVTRVVRRGGREHLFRAAACTGALYHVDLYLVAGDGAGVDAGVYHFDPLTLSLDVLRRGDFRGVLADVAREPAVERAPVTVVATSTWWRNAWLSRRSHEATISI